MAAANRAHHLILSVFLAAGLGCRGEDSSPDQGSEPADEKQEGAAPPSSPLGMMSTFLSAASDEPGPYDEPESSPGASADAPHVAVLELSGDVVEQRSFGWFAGFSGLEHRALGDRLRELAASEKVEALLLRFDGFSAQLAHAEELRALLAEARAARPDRPIACFAESADIATYYLMSACSQIGIAEGGQLSITGVAAVPVHLKGLLDKLGVTADFIHLGAYKGAAEPLTREAPSPQARETTAMILDRAFDTLVAGIAEGRGISEDQVRAAIDEGLLAAEAAREKKLIDAVAQFEPFRAELAGERPWRVVKIEENKNPTAELFSLLGVTPTPRPSGERVALVYALGNVVDGRGEGVAGARSEIASRPLAAALRALAADDEVEAVVIRVDSPGGSALASEIIWTAVGELVAKKPVVVSMGPVAASGGYYISAGATKIFALENTLTGSIGVVGGKIAPHQGLARLGVATYPEGRGRHALLFASTRPWTAEQRAVIEASMADVYQRFAARVRQGRGEIPDEVMQGRVWTGAAAKERGLVDEIGGLDAALAEARKLAELPADSPVEVYPPEPTLKDLLGGLGVSAGARGASAAVGLEAALEAVPPAVARQLSATLRLALGFRDTSIQAAAFLPALVF